jgi:hypothetical protein
MIAAEPELRRQRGIEREMVVKKRKYAPVIPIGEILL